jgi:hypothetical protein
VTHPRDGSTDDRKPSTIYLAKQLWESGGGETQRSVEDDLGLEHGKLADMLCLGKPGLEEWDFATTAEKAYAAGRLSDRFIFEFGLWKLVDVCRTDSEMKALLNKRHEAYKTFADGIDRMRRGEFPLPPSRRGGRPKRWAKATPEERRSAFDAWLDKIEELGCDVLDAEEWLAWFHIADPASTMEQFLWRWCDGWPPGEAPCPPWVFGLDLDYWENSGALNRPELLDRLILVTESDMPYNVYHGRFEHSSSIPRLGGHLISHAVTGFRVTNGRLQLEPEFEGDDLDAWANERQAQAAHAAAQVSALFDRVRGRRKTGGAGEKSELS